MTDPGDVRRLPSDDELAESEADRQIGARLQAAYMALPPRPASHAESVAAWVVANATRGSAPSVGALPRRRLVALRSRWWWGAAAAAVLVVVVMRPWRPGASSRDADSVFTDGLAAASAPQGAVVPVAGGLRFELTLPSSAREVALVGDFNGWNDDATPMTRGDAGAPWTAQLPLTPGRHVYAFVVDGERWIVDPLAPQVPDVDFGPANAVVVPGKR